MENDEILQKKKPEIAASVLVGRGKVIFSHQFLVDI